MNVEANLNLIIFDCVSANGGPVSQQLMPTICHMTKDMSLWTCDATTVYINIHKARYMTNLYKPSILKYY